MVSIIQNARSYRADRSWGARDIAEIEGASVRLHWTDSGYQWHANSGDEVFMVVDGEVVMHYREDGEEMLVSLKPGDMFVAVEGDEHRAEPVGEARVLVIERKGTI